MSIGSILALVDGGPGSQGVLQTATRLARTCGSYLEVLHVTVDPETVIPVVAEGMSGTAVAQIVESTRQGAEKRAEEAHRLFQDSVRKEGLKVTSTDADPQPGTFAVAWTQVQGREAGEAAQRGRLFDMTVLARPGEEEGSAAAVTLEAALFETGRPILIAPPEAPAAFPKHVVLAWDASREAARAVWAARPLLEAAAQVSIVTVLEGNEEANPVELARYLMRLGISADTHLVKRGKRDIGSCLLDSATDLKADLLAMGGYGHSRVRELILGGATRSVIERAGLPILMAH